MLDEILQTELQELRQEKHQTVNQVYNFEFEQENEAELLGFKEMETHVATQNTKFTQILETE